MANAEGRCRPVEVKSCAESVRRGGVTLGHAGPQAVLVSLFVCCVFGEIRIGPLTRA